MFLAVRSNASDPAVEPNPGVLVVADFTKPLGGILRTQLLPESRVVFLIELREPLILHHLAYLLGRVSLLVRFLQQYAINLFGFIRASLHELYGHIRMLLLRETEYLVPFFLPATDPLPKLSGPCGRPSKNPSQNWKRRKEL
jgi:hypothetical protein